MGMATLVAVALNAAAQEPATNTPAVTTAVLDEPDPYLRDPFIPAGITPKHAPQSVEQPVQRIPDTTPFLTPASTTNAAGTATPPPEIRWPAPPKITALAKKPGGGYMAIMEGVGPVEEGTTVRKRVDRLTFIWKVESITEKGVALKKMDVRAGK